MEVGVAFHRNRLIEVLIYHQQINDGIHVGVCSCGWGRRPEQLGRSWAIHIADVYEDKVFV